MIIESIPDVGRNWLHGTAYGARFARFQLRDTGAGLMAGRSDRHVPVLGRAAIEAKISELVGRYMAPRDQADIRS